MYPERTKFEYKCDAILFKKSPKACVEYIDKMLRKGKLSLADSLNAYFIKTELFNHYYQCTWTTQPHKLITDSIALSKIETFNYLDSAISSCDHFVKLSQPIHPNYKNWSEELLGPILNEIVNPLEARIRDNPYQKSTSQKINAIQQLKKWTTPYHSINQLGFDLYIANIQLEEQQLSENDVSMYVSRIEDFLLNSFEHYDYASFHSTQNANYVGYTHIMPEAISFCEKLCEQEHPQRWKLMNMIHQFRRNLKGVGNYNTKWIFQRASIADSNFAEIDRPNNHDKKETLSTFLGLIDLRDSSHLPYNNFTMVVDLDFSYDVPTWDTLFIHTIQERDQYSTCQLVNTLKLSGKGDTTLQILFYQFVPDNNTTRNISRNFTVYTNRGVKKITIEMDVIGPTNWQKPDFYADTVLLYSRSLDEYNLEHTKILSIHSDSATNTKQINIYHYPYNTDPICVFTDSSIVSPNLLIDPFDINKDGKLMFRLIKEYPDYYHVLYGNNTLLGPSIGWIKKKEIDISTVSLDRIVSYLNWTDYFSSADYIVLRNPYDRKIKFTPERKEFFDPCSKFELISFNEKGFSMVLKPFKECSSAEFEEVESIYFPLNPYNEYLNVKRGFYEQ